MKFEIPLTEQRVKPHQITALHLFSALAFIVVGALGYVLYKNQTLSIALTQSVTVIGPALAWRIAALYGSAGILILGILMLKNRWAIQKLPNNVFRSIELALSLLILVNVIILQIWVLVALFAVLTLALCYALYLENNRSKPVYAIVSEEGIRPPAMLRRRFIEWRETERVLLKHGTLTVTCTDNRLYQWNYKSINFDVVAFHAFCDAQIEAHKSKRVQDW